ncbi:conserved hypothetical protein [Xenorhabdus bovienii str. kraussei Quebec]|uniref:Uncharacterized protein n=1 Tax=Xenorhabdus bovienii str. kraussei Quebec TaxID=1398203 RepID=A0A077PMS6_XENBV|nr:hypothetical protein [Xenorhabdus bovienii]CDH21877.1 conserved hypothetical protein [Xenorhabdus bovienii str. kraussei Quebec]
MTINFAPVKKGTIMLLTGAKEHLFFICSDPVLYPQLTKECFLAVNLTTIYSDIEYDNTCILSVGDHPFVNHDSYILYKKAEILGVDTVTSQVIAGDIRVSEPCRNDVFDRILNGFNTSPHVKPKVRKFYTKYCV